MTLFESVALTQGIALTERTTLLPVLIEEFCIYLNRFKTSKRKMFDNILELYKTEALC